MSQITKDELKEIGFERVQCTVNESYYIEIFKNDSITITFKELKSVEGLFFIDYKIRVGYYKYNKKEIKKLCKILNKKL